jgi:hypothetical protein
VPEQIVGSENPRAGGLRALVLSNMRPDGRHPERGRFVRDQVDALRGLGEWQLELY